MRVLVINVLVLLVGAILAELLFGGWVRDDPLALLNVPRDVHIVYDVTLPDGRRWQADYRRDRWGLRGPFSAPEAVDLVTLGGSTTDQRLLPEGATWQDVLASELRRRGVAVEIANAGVDGQSTIGHLRSLDVWLPHVAGLRPRYVLAYVGINDVAVDGRDSYDSLLPPDTLWRKLTDHSALYRLYRTVRGIIRAERYGISHGLQVEPTEAWQPAPVVPDDPARIGAYDLRLQALIERIRQWGAEPILVTQPQRDWRVEDGVAYSRDGVSPDLAMLNRQLLRTCSATAVRCLDMAGELRFQAGDFYDPLHNTPQGAARIGAWLAERLAPLLARPD